MTRRRLILRNVSSMIFAMTDFGTEEGDVCWRNGCQGVIHYRYEGDGCSCHQWAPCAYCTSSTAHCPTCDWTDEWNYSLNGYVMKTDRSQMVSGYPAIKEYKRRPLDPRRLDYHDFHHTHFTMIKEGVYPDGMTREEIEKEVRGTFGGRFVYCQDGKFKYIAQTD